MTPVVSSRILHSTFLTYLSISRVSYSRKRNRILISRRLCSGLRHEIRHEGHSAVGRAEATNSDRTRPRQESPGSAVRRSHLGSGHSKRKGEKPSLGPVVFLTEATRGTDFVTDALQQGASASLLFLPPVSCIRQISPLSFSARGNALCG